MSPSGCNTAVVERVGDRTAHNDSSLLENKRYSWGFHLLRQNLKITLNSCRRDNGFIHSNTTNHP